MSTPNVPISLRASTDTLKRIEILNKIKGYPKHQVKSKLFTLLIKGECETLLKELRSKKNPTQIEKEVIEELTLLEG